MIRAEGVHAGDPFLVIGAGPLGLGMAKGLAEAGIPYVHAEATDHVGGNWAHGVYETAHIISSKRTTEYPDHPMPESYPDFPSAQQMKAYYEDYADTFGLRSAIRFGCEVTAVRPRDDGRWDVTLRTGDTESDAVFKGVLVCNGHHWKRALPDWAGDWPADRLLHSKDYKRPDQLQGRQVLVVGGGNSGCDIVSEAARVGASATWSLRRGYWFMPKTLLGIPTVELMRPWLPVAVQRVMMRTLLRLVVGPYSAYGLPKPTHRLFDAHPSVSTEALHYLKHGRVTVVPDVTGVFDGPDGPRLRLADGRELEPELVVCATGYHLDFPFLPPGLLPIQGKTAQVLGPGLIEGHKHLYVLGTQQVRYGIGPLIRPAARLVARWIQMQDALELPVADVLVRLGQTPPTSHLIDPHQALRRMWLAEHLYEGVILRRGRRYS